MINHEQLSKVLWYSVEGTVAAWLVILWVSRKVLPARCPKFLLQRSDRRPVPVLQDLPMVAKGRQQYPNQSNFWESPKNILVLDTFEQFAKYWSWFGCVYYDLSKDWRVVEIDNRLAGPTLEFEFQGKPCFRIAYWHNILSCQKDLEPIIHELRPLILTALLANPQVMQATEKI